MQLTKRLFALSVLVGAAAWADDAKKKAPPTLSSEEQDFYWKAAAGGLFGFFGQGGRIPRKT